MDSEINVCFNSSSDKITSTGFSDRYVYLGKDHWFYILRKIAVDYPNSLTRRHFKKMIYI